MSRIWTRQWADDIPRDPWAHSFLESDVKVQLRRIEQPPGSALYLEPPTMKQYALFIMKYLPEEPTERGRYHVHVTFENTQRIVDKDAGSLRALGNFLLHGLNRRLGQQSSHWRLRAFWFISSWKMSHRPRDLTGSTVKPYQLPALGLMLGFGPVELVDL